MPSTISESGPAGLHAMVASSSAAAGYPQGRSTPPVGARVGPAGNAAGLAPRIRALQAALAVSSAANERVALSNFSKVMTLVDRSLDAPKPRQAIMPLMHGPDASFSTPRFNSLYEALTHCARQYPTSRSFVFLDVRGKPGRTVTVETLLARVERTAVGIAQKFHIAPSSSPAHPSTEAKPSIDTQARVAIVFNEDEPAAAFHGVVALLASLRAGVVPVIVPMRSAATEVELERCAFLLEACGVTDIISDKPSRKAVSTLLASGLASKTTMRVWTAMRWTFSSDLKKSGSLPPLPARPTPLVCHTHEDGVVRGLTLTQATLIAQCRALIAACDIDSPDRILAAFSPTHHLGLVLGVLLPLVASSSAVLMPRVVAADAAQVLKLSVDLAGELVVVVFFYYYSKPCAYSSLRQKWIYVRSSAQVSSLDSRLACIMPQGRSVCAWHVVKTREFSMHVRSHMHRDRQRSAQHEHTALTAKDGPRTSLADSQPRSCPGSTLFGSSESAQDGPSQRGKSEQSHLSTTVKPNCQCLSWLLSGCGCFSVHAFTARVQAVVTVSWSAIAGAVSVRGPGQQLCFSELGLRALANGVVRRSKEESDTLEFSDNGFLLPGTRRMLGDLYEIGIF
jgi:hypothetical protein